MLDITGRELHLQELGGKIIHLDEVLTMSARMAAATGDPRWERRYREYEPQLDAALGEAITLAPEAAEGGGAAETEAANLALLRMEAEAFRLVRDGRSAAAQQLLLSDDYENQKRRYATSIGQTLAGIRRRIQEQMILHQRRFAAAVVTGAAATAVLFLVWMRIIIGLRQHLRGRRQAETEILRLNDELEGRVRERTVALAERSRVLRSILDSMAEGVIVADRDGRFLYWNAAAARIMGAGPESMAIEDWPGGYHVYCPDGVTRYPAAQLPLVRAIRGESVDEAEAVVRRPGESDGVRCIANARPLADAGDELRGGVVVFRDVTVERQAEQARRESEQRFRKIFEEGPLGMALVDLQARILDVNGQLCGLTGYAERELVGRDLRDIVRSESAVWDPQVEARILSGEQAMFHGDLGYVRKDGAALWATLTASLIRSDAGQPLYGLVMVQDITDRRRAEHAAKRHQAELARVLRVTTAGEMASGLAHELNQPLCAIGNYANGCLRRLDGGGLDGEAFRYPIERIAAESLRAGRIVHNLLDFVRKGESRKVGAAELNDVVRQAAQLAEVEAWQHEVTIRLDLAPDLPRLTIDAVQIEQVILNLTLNATEAMVNTTGPHEIQISTRRSGSATVEVSVRDAGHGIAPGIEARLFEPFFTTKASGLGMGLSISYSIIEGHGGRIWAEANPSGGSIFRFTLPVDDDAGAG